MVNWELSRKTGAYAGLTIAALGGVLIAYQAYKTYRSKSDSLWRVERRIGDARKPNFNTKDESSLSNIDDVITIHTNLSYKVDFVHEVLTGVVELELRAIKDVSFILLDAKLLKISKVYDNQQKPLKFTYYESVVPALGDQLAIDIQCRADTSITIFIEFQTIKTDQQVALNWLNPKQTYGGRLPFLFSQSEPIYARTMFPCQDSPSSKSTYDFYLTVDPEFKAYASGLFKSFDKQTNTFHFQQQIPIPSYLVAILVGDLREKKISDRISVIAEPQMIDRSHKEFEDMELYLSTIEKYLTPYQWGQFNVVVLPKSFPFGGMENPNLTFLSPSVVVGDKSAVSVVIHEMVHSWAGNSMTCQNWSCFWLNEGITVFIEQEIIREIFGERAYKLKVTQNNIDLNNAVKSIGYTHTYTSLTPELNQANPDDCFSCIPYNKGSQFLMYLQDNIPNFQQFIRKVLTTNDTLNTDQFKQQLDEFSNNKPLLFDDWVKLSGYALVPLYLQFEVKDEYSKLTEQFKEYKLDLTKYESNEIIFILDLYVEQAYTKENVLELDEAYKLSSQLNPDIQSRFLKMAISTGLTTRYNTQIQDFLLANGRMKFILGLYKCLKDHEPKIGQHIFQICRSGYHSIAVAQIQRIFA